MAHFVKLDQNNMVITGVVVNNDAIDADNEEQTGIEFLNNLYGTNDNWKQTSYNNKIRGNYAGIGMFYCDEHDLFMHSKCHDEAVLNVETARWDCTNKDHEIDFIS